MNGTLSEEDEWILILVQNCSNFMTLLSTIALFVNLYLLNCSRYLRRPIGVNLRLCVSLTASDALCALFYILSFTVNVFMQGSFSNCFSLLLEVFKLATFFASVFTLLALALNHYVGIVHPLHRHAITPSTVRWAIALAYVVPIFFLLTLYSAVPGGFRAHSAFDFFHLDGCKHITITKNMSIRWIIVLPFIFVVIILTCLYLHILVYMARISKDPLLQSSAGKKKRTSNRKLLVTLMLLAGSACIGWLPTTINYVLTCRDCMFPISDEYSIILGMLAQILNVSKLIMDSFIYASRLIEVRYAIWKFHYSIRKLVMPNRYRKNDEQIPTEFTRYLSETKESRAQRSKKYNMGSSVVSSSLRGRPGSVISQPSLRGSPNPRSQQSYRSVEGGISRTASQ